MILINGCSFTFGKELSGPNHLADHQLDPKHLEIISKNRWSFYLENNLKNPTINLAKSGSSNDRIFRTTLECLSPAIKLVIIGWTRSERLEVWEGNEYSRLMAASDPAKKDMDFFHKAMFHFYPNAKTTSYLFLKNVYSMQCILKTHNIPYLFFHALPYSSQFTTIDKNDCLYQRIENFLGFDDFSFLSKTKHLPYFNQDNQMGHPGFEAHKYWGDFLSSIIQSNYVLK